MSDKKVYVEVLLRVDEEGRNHPESITFKTEKKYNIDKVTDVRRACAMKVGGTAMRYTVKIGSKTTYLFEDKGKWFVEASEG